MQLYIPKLRDQMTGKRTIASIHPSGQRATSGCPNHLLQVPTDPILHLMLQDGTHRITPSYPIIRLPPLGTQIHLLDYLISLG
jgi:hypothetical protein